MIIWLICGLFKPHTGGCAAYAELLVQHLRKNGDIRHVFLITEYAPGDLWHSDGKVTVLRILPRRDSREFSSAIYRGATFAVTHVLLLVLILLISIFRRRDCLHFHSRLVYPWTGFAVRLLKVRALADVRDNFAQVSSVAAFPLSVYVSRQIYDGLRRLIPEQKLVHIPVPIDAREIVRLGHRKIVTNEHSKPYFLFVGTISASKGIPELIEAYCEYRRIHGEASPQLLLAGPNRLSNGTDLNAIAGVRYLGSLGEEEVYPLMAGADRLILPSKAEGMPRVCLEAMVLGMPVVCPPHVVEFETWCSHCVLPEITPAAILMMLERPRETLLANGYPLEHHCWNDTVELYHNVYRKLAA